MTKQEIKAMKDDLLTYNGHKRDEKFRYMMLSRMESDCKCVIDHFCERHLWAGDIKAQIVCMKALYKSFRYSQRPRWITWSQIKKYQKQLLKAKRANRG